MKFNILVFLSVILTMDVFSQNHISETDIYKKDSIFTKIDSLLIINNAHLQQIEINHIKEFTKDRYKIYQTENLYNLILLDTMTGRVKGIQWSLDVEKEFIYMINSEYLNFDNNYIAGRFELYPTKNIYQFILLDKTTGKCWHVQWGLKDSKRWIREI